MENDLEKPESWLDRPIFSRIHLTWEIGLLAVILILAVVTRFYDLESRVMSHDETIHVYHNSWSLYSGQGYKHDPLSHGPFQTHVVALSYFLFGDSDLTARIPAVVFSIATVGFIWFYRRYLGRAGTIVAMVMMLLSPYMLYYGRYVRNEAFAAFAGVVLLWGVLRYLETGEAKYTYFITLATVLHFTAKETAFIYTAQVLLFLGFYFIYRISQASWIDGKSRTPFVLFLTSSIGLLGAAGILAFMSSKAGDLSATQTAQPAVPGQGVSGIAGHGPSVLVIGLLVLGLVGLIAAVYFLVRGITWKRLRDERSLGLIILIGSFVLPQLSAFPVFFAGWNIPTNASEVSALNNLDIVRIAIFFVPFLIISIALGLLWNRRTWLINAAIFYTFFIIIYTTVFTNGAGFFTGMVGSLGYWLKQQEVQRGSQPWYYYIFVQIPIYEYLPALASFLGYLLMAFGKRPLLRFTQAYQENHPPELVDIEGGESDPEIVVSEPEGQRLHSPQRLQSPQRLHNPLQSTTLLSQPGQLQPAPVLALLGFWVLSGTFAYSYAGEKMPWLTVHLAWPMVLFGGWAIGYIIDTVDWQNFRKWRGWLVLLLLIIFISSFLATLGSLYGEQPPLQGKNLDQLQATSTFVTSLVVVLISGYLLWRLVGEWPVGQFLRVVLLTIFAGMAILTGRAAIQSSYINYDNANEYLVYAHSAGGVKEIMRQVEEISRRTTDGTALTVAYDGEYPFWWYLRRYQNARYFGSNPTRSLREAPVIIVGDSNFGKIEPVVGQAYDEFNYIRLWWPNQDYFNLTWDRIKNAISDPAMRSALFQVWLNRDFTKYGQATNKDMSLENWNPAARMRLYIRKDIVSQIWEYGSAPAAQVIEADPYEGKQIQLQPDVYFGEVGSEPGQFMRPRDIAAAADGSLFVADTENHRIQHLAADGTVIKVWGSFGDIASGTAMEGTFNQPWGIAVDPEGFVYVADTWNHRIQKFTSNGDFVKMWGYFGQAEVPEAFYGPRDIAIDKNGRLYVTDTGNKRIVIFDGDGNYINQFGSGGFDAGQFDEPVGVAVDGNGVVYVADTWNQRIQTFIEQDGVWNPQKSWDVVGWYGQSLDNKPFLAVDEQGYVYAADPEGWRVLMFTTGGDFVQYWGDFSAGPDGFGLVGSVAVSPDGGVWVSDTGNSRLLHFTIPQKLGGES